MLNTNEKFLLAIESVILIVVVVFLISTLNEYFENKEEVSPKEYSELNQYCNGNNNLYYIKNQCVKSAEDGKVIRNEYISIMQSY
jgi:hypothetical protein